MGIFERDYDGSQSPRSKKVANRRERKRTRPKYPKYGSPPIPPNQTQQPSLLERLSQTKVFVTYIILVFFTIGITASCAYLRVNSCSLIHDKSVKVNGSTALAPLMKDIASKYKHGCIGTDISVNNVPNLATGSLNGLQQVSQDTIDIGTSDVFANPYQTPGLQDYQVAVATFALVVNKDVQVTNLTTPQIRDIYSGTVTNWGSIENNKENLHIVLVSRPPTSGTRLTFEKYVLDGIETFTGPQSLVNDTSDSVAQSVNNQAGAIGYVSLYYAKYYHLKTLSIDGKDPFDATLVKNGSYSFWNIEHMYTHGAPSGVVKDFVTYMFGSTAKQIFTQDDYLDLAEFPLDVLVHHVA